jgi:hypothetical protein
MRIGYAAVGIAVLATAACNPLGTRSTSAPAMPPATAPATAPTVVPTAPPATVYVTPSETPTLPEFVRVPDLAFRRLDVAEYVLSSTGLGHSVIGMDDNGRDGPSDYMVCSMLPRAGTRVRSDTRVALVVQWVVCDNRPDR